VLWRITKAQNKAYDKKAEEIRKELKLGEFDSIPEDREAELPSLINPFSSFNFRTVILDECQQIKNQNSKRAGQVREICREVPHVMALSGSPIENNAGEYFTILNITKAERFPTYKSYVENDCDWYWSGRGYKIGGLRDPVDFREKTKDFIIRRKQKDVLPDLPELRRNFINCEFASDKIKREYDDLAAEFAQFYYEEEGSVDFQQGLLARMAKMRHTVGRNKAPFIAEQVEDFILDTPQDRKIVVFIHHQDVMMMIQAILNKAFDALRSAGAALDNPLTFTSDLNSEKRNDIIEEFRTNPRARVLLGSALAMAEGLNLQFCYDCIVAERMWNPKKEEQMERRFIRPSQDDGKKESCVNANYPTVIGTIDEYFTEIVEVKRANVDQTLDGEGGDFSEAGLMKELASVLAQKGGKKWRLN
jgi:SNF2 family DNA or RNA helicase